MYRGHKKRGLVALGATALAGAFLAKATVDYNNAKAAYDDTTVEELQLDLLDAGGGLPRPFESHYLAYESKANTANAAAIVLAVVWGSSVLDNLILEPNRFELRWTFGQ